MLLGFMSKYRLLDKIMEREFSVIKLRKMNINSQPRRAKYRVFVGQSEEKQSPFKL